MKVLIRTMSGNEITATVPATQWDFVCKELREYPTIEFTSDNGLIVLRTEHIESVQIQES
ncbi:hypothetical protein GCM10028833_30510 [Glycomyces tarimensis]